MNFSFPIFLQVSEDSFQNIFDLSFDNEDSKYAFGSRGLDFLAPLSSNSFNNNNNNNNNSFKNKNNDFNSSFELEDQQQLSTQSWRNDFSRSQQQQRQQQQQQQQQDDLEQAFANLYSKQRQPSSSAQVNKMSSYI